jgi:hypothetical protein
MIGLHLTFKSFLSQMRPNNSCHTGNVLTGWMYATRIKKKWPKLVGVSICVSLL